MNVERQGAIFEIQDMLVEGLDKPGEPARNPDGGREEEGVVWRGQGTVEHKSKSDKKDADEVKKIRVKMFQQFPPK